jgi:hypothetical protein
VVDGATSNNLKHILVDTMVLFGDLNKDNIAYKLITFGVGGVSVFQAVRIGVIVHLKNQNVPFMIGVHCMSHRINLVIQTLSKLSIVEKMKMCYRGYMHISHIFQKNLRSSLNWLTSWKHEVNKF